MGNIFPPINPRIIEEIKKTESAIIIGHPYPDGDALSSSLALNEMLTALGKDAYLINEGPFLYRELREKRSLFNKTVPESFIEKNPTVFIMDCSTESRAGISYQNLKHLKTIIIDHHASGCPFTEEDLCYIVPASPSTTILLDNLRTELGLPLTDTLAKYFYIGLATDTGFFHFIDTDIAPEVFKRASIYTSYGVSPYDIEDNSYDGRSMKDLTNLAEIIMNSRTYYSGKLLIAEQSPEMGDSKYSDAIFLQTLTLKGIKAIAYIWPQQDGTTAVNFRAKKNMGIDVGEIAVSLGGGGHMLASGATIHKSPEEARNLILSIFEPILTSK